MRLLPLLLLMILLRPALGQALRWEKQIGDSTDQELVSFQVDKDGSIILFGKYLTYPEAAARPAKSPGNYSLFLHKLDTAGNTLWFRHLGSPYSDWALGMDIDPAGNIYVLGSMADYPYNCKQGCGLSSTGSDSARLDTAGSRTFLARYSPAGKVQWVRQFSPNTSFQLKLNPEIRVQNGKVYVYGFFLGELGFHGYPDLIANSGSENYGFVAVVDAEGSPRRLDTLGYPGYVSAAEEDPSGNLFLGFEQGANHQFVEKRDSTGRSLWRKEIFTSSGTSGSAIDRIYRDAAGNIYVAGRFSYMAVFRLDDGRDTTVSTPFTTEFFLEKLNPDGSIGWIKAGAESGRIKTGVPLPGSGLLFARVGKPFLYRARANGSIDSLPQLSLDQIHLAGDGRTLVAARVLEGATPTSILNRNFLSAGKKDILLVRLDLEAPSAIRRSTFFRQSQSGRLRYSPLGRVHPGPGPHPVPDFRKRAAQPDIIPGSVLPDR